VSKFIEGKLRTWVCVGGEMKDVFK